MENESIDLEVQIQRKYYSETANRYDAMHGGEASHDFAYHVMVGAINFLKIESLLDIGAGTGANISRVKLDCPNIFAVGVEPVKELRDIGYQNGLSSNTLIDGDGSKLAFESNSFDLVCEYAMLHHVKTPEIVVGEMLRVARKAIFISDSNNFGQGSLISRAIKQGLDLVGLWPFANYLKTKGRGYILTEGDGLSYSYSVFNNLNLIKKRCKEVYIVNTSPYGGHDCYRAAASVAVLGVKG